MLEMGAELCAKADHLTWEALNFLNGTLAVADISVLWEILENLLGEGPAEEASESEESPMKHTKRQLANVSSKKKDP